ncbi:MAG: HalOD1 output domain-containing protein [Halovenus sp.]
MYNVSSNQSTTEAIIEAVAEYSETAPIPEFTPTGASTEALEPLYHAIDPDALEALIERSTPEAGQTIEVSFDYMGYEITVSNEENIWIKRPEITIS